MKNLKELEQSGISLEIISKECIDERLLRRQIDTNGSLNDFNIDDLPGLIFTAPLSGLLAIVNSFPGGKDVTLNLRNRENTFIPFCDFPLAIKEKDLQVQNQIKSMYEHIERKYLTDLSIQLGGIPFTTYSIGRILLNRNNRSGELEILENDAGSFSPINYWQTIGKLLEKEDTQYTDLYKKLLSFGRNLREGFNKGIEDAHEYMPCFVNISNMLAMIYENHPRQKKIKPYQVYFKGSDKAEIAHLEDLDERVFLDYEKTRKIVENKSKRTIISLEPRE